MTSETRPLSPHLQVYKPQLTTVLSILHRGTGLVLSFGLPLLVYWLIAAANGAGSFARAQAFFGSVLGQLALFGWSFAFFYHLCNGIRHLVWDAGMGFELRQAYASGWAVVVASLALTVLTWAVVFTSGGGA